MTKRMNVEDFIGDFNDSLEEDTGSISPTSACSTSELESESEGPRWLNFSERSLPLHSFNGKDVNRTKKKKEVTPMPMKVARAMSVRLGRLVTNFALQILY